MVTVYLCDDVAALRLVLRTLFELDGSFDVVGEASDGRTAVAEILRLRPHVVVLDLSLPELDGLEVLEAIRKSAPEVRTVVFTGYPETELGPAAAALGARRYVEKGVDIDRVAEAVREVAAEPA